MFWLIGKRNIVISNCSNRKIRCLHYKFVFCCIISFTQDCASCFHKMFGTSRKHLLSSRPQVWPRQWARQRQRGHVLRALPALHPPHAGDGQTLHPQDLFILHIGRHVWRPWQPRAPHAAAPGRVPGLRRKPGVLLRRRHHAVPLREAGGLFGNDVSGFRAHGQRQGSTGGFCHR